MATPIDRQIRRMERKVADLYEQAVTAEFEGPNWLVPKLEAQIRDIEKDLIRLEGKRGIWDISEVKP